MDCSSSETRASGASGGGLRGASLRRPILLVVDDISLVRSAVRTALGLDLPGVDIREAASGAEALALLLAERVDAVLADIHMPGIDGLELSERIHELAGNVPVVLMGSEALGGAGPRGVGGGVVGMLRKPFSRGALARVVAGALCGFRDMFAGATRGLESTGAPPRPAEERAGGEGAGLRAAGGGA